MNAMSAPIAAIFFAFCPPESDIYRRAYDLWCRHGPIGGVLMQAKITKRVVDAAQKQSASYLVRDSEVKGFVLVVTPAGAKSYAVDYRAGSGRGAPKRRLTIGKHGSPWTPETARIEAKRLLAEVAAGRDPATARQEERNALTFGELTNLYLAEGAGHKKLSTLKV